jgi:hypothetical protein
MKKLILSFLFSAASLLVFSQTITVNVTEVKEFTHYGNVDYTEVMANPLWDNDPSEVKSSYVIDTTNKTVDFVIRETKGTKKIKSFSENDGVFEVVIIDTYGGTKDNTDVKMIIDSNKNTVVYTYFNDVTGKTMAWNFTKFKIVN